MKHVKKVLLPLLLGFSVCLSGCTLFNDDDMAYENQYHPAAVTPEVPPEDPTAVKAQGVAGTTIDEVPDTLFFKSVGYDQDGKIINTYKIGGVNHKEYNVYSGSDYEASQRTNNYDLYVPNSASKNDKHLVILFIHGGAWVGGFKTDVNSYVQEYAKKGYITATIKYTLLKRTMDDNSLSIFRNLDEIDACIKSIKAALIDLGFDTTKTQLAIGGASSGAHLTMLYAYSRGQHAALPIRFLVDAVGPVDIKPENWKSFKNTETGTTAGLTNDAISGQETNLGPLYIAGEDGKYWNDYQTMRIANGMCGLPYTLEQVKACTDDKEEEIVHDDKPAAQSMTKANGGEDQLSVTYWMNQGINKFPMVCAYAGMDSIVGIAQYAKLEKCMDDNAIEHDYVYFKDQNHDQITREKNQTAYDAFIAKIDAQCETALA